MLTQICLFFSFYFTENKHRENRMLVSFPELCAMNWTFCLSSLKGFNWQSSFTSERFPNNHWFSPCLYASPESVYVGFSYPTLTPGSTVSTWIGHTRNTMIKPGKTLPQWHVGCMPWGRVLQGHTQTHTHLCALCDRLCLSDKVNWFGH